MGHGRGGGKGKARNRVEEIVNKVWSNFTHRMNDKKFKSDQERREAEDAAENVVVNLMQDVEVEGNQPTFKLAETRMEVILTCKEALLKCEMLGTVNKQSKAVLKGFVVTRDLFMFPVGQTGSGAENPKMVSRNLINILFGMDEDRYNVLRKAYDEIRAYEEQQKRSGVPSKASYDLYIQFQNAEHIINNYPKMRSLFSKLEQAFLDEVAELEHKCITMAESVAMRAMCENLEAAVGMVIEEGETRSDAHLRLEKMYQGDVLKPEAEWSKMTKLIVQAGRSLEGDYFDYKTFPIQLFSKVIRIGRRIWGNAVHGIDEATGVCGIKNDDFIKRYIHRGQIASLDSALTDFCLADQQRRLQEWNVERMFLIVAQAVTIKYIHISDSEDYSKKIAKLELESKVKEVIDLRRANMF